MLEAEGYIRVIGQAVDGLDAVEQIKKLRPQVVTMDVEMPKLDGIAALRRVMRENTVPVIMLSALTTEGARATMQALASGALDFVPKPTKLGQLAPMLKELAAKIRVAAGVSMRKVASHTALPAANPHPKPAAPPGPKPAASRPAPTFTAKKTGKIEIVVIGCSTGGPVALQNIVPNLPANFPVGIVVVQHIPAGFSQSLAEHLNRRSALEVIHGSSGDEVRPGRVIVAPAGCELHFVRSGGRVTVKTAKCGEPIPPATFRPSVDQVLNAATEAYGGSILGVLLTGMGRDGAEGMLQVKKLGGRTIAQDESSCVVFGMPRAAIELGAVDKIVPLSKIAQEIINMV